MLTAGDQELRIDTMLPKLLHVEQLTRPERSSEAALAAKPSSFGRGRSSSYCINNSRGSRNDSSSNRSGRAAYQETRRCFYCKKAGHIQRDCRQRKRDGARFGEQP